MHEEEMAAAWWSGASGFARRLDISANRIEQRRAGKRDVESNEEANSAFSFDWDAHRI
jgi:hypothetical protein